MTIEITVPQLGESVTEATVAQWLKKTGDAVEIDEPIVELETDKVTLEVNAQKAGIMGEILVNTGEDVEVGAVLGSISTDGTAPIAKPQTEAKPEPVAATPAVVSEPVSAPVQVAQSQKQFRKHSPAVERLLKEHNLDAATIRGTGKDGRLIKSDIQDFLENRGSSAAVTTQPAAPAAAPAAPTTAPTISEPSDRPEEIVPMSRLRRRVAERLKESQNTAATLTTFNDVDMSAIMGLRKEYKENFKKQHDVNLGFMSFFIKASIQALKEIPAANAEIRGDEIIYKKYYDMSVAVSTPNGLVVPVLRDVDKLSFAGIEKGIVELAIKARDGKLTMADLTGGTFSITNGGTFGSMMSTPILNPPQVAILGMHRIEQRPIAINGEVVIRPMMYLALSYDHRIIDGREAVTFLRRIKEGLEDPHRLLLDV